MLARAAALAITLALAAPAAAQAATPPPRQFYVSLGDSYASGFQPGRGNTRNGFAYQVPGLAAARGYRLTLVNFGCGGATTSSILHRVGCRPAALGPGGVRYPTATQAVAAERFLRAHRGHVALITVSIGGNDVTPCFRAPDPSACGSAAVAQIKRDVGVLARGLRRAAGRDVRIVGTTYPDVALGLYLTDQNGQNLAKLSVVGFKSLFNPALKSAYATAQGRLVDVTAATGAYGSFNQTTNLPPYGVIPVPVARVCQLTYFCALRDIHARTNGYRVIARLVAQTLPWRQ
jgi:lysophospholipase L1-like esterase